MTPETEQNINTAIKWIQETGGSIQDFASEQAPLYCREVIAWEFWSGLIFGGIGAILFAIGIAAAMRFVRFIKEDDGEINGRTLSALVIAIICLFLGPVMVGDFIPRAIKAHVAPRMVIIEHISQFRK